MAEKRVYCGVWANIIGPDITEVCSVQCILVYSIATLQSVCTVLSVVQLSVVQLCVVQLTVVQLCVVQLSVVGLEQEQVGRKSPSGPTVYSRTCFKILNFVEPYKVR